MDYLKEKGSELHRPQSALLRNGIRELRVQLKGKNTRTLYFFYYENYIVLTHIFIKTTQLVPEKEIDKALAYQEDFIKRFDIDNIKGA
ncbi:MAG: type II toxin-antitoxin system RelE/ParE family toxin [Bacteroidetes bacterium]|nr:type II toxin-antitoxin system RelE/ParE family toxin [Bacteroidota bacterium]